MNATHVFPDVNVLLHFPAFDGLDWCALCDAEEVIIHLTQPLLSELNRVKDTGHNKPVRKRAASVQRRLKELLRTEGSTAKLSKGLTVVLESLSPSASEFPDLNPAVADDVLLAAVLVFCRSSGLPAKLVTDDDGFALMVKASKWNIEVIEPPDSERLPAEPDPEAKEREELRKKVAKIESALPRPVVTFADGKTIFHLSKSETDGEAVVKEMSDLRREHRKLDDPKAPKSVRGFSLGRMLEMKASFADIMNNDPAEVERYNRELDEFFARYELALRANLAIDARKCEIRLQVENTGSAPACDVLVELHFPNGFNLIEANCISGLYEELPDPPCKPGHARGIGHLLGDIGRDYSRIRAAPNPNAPTLQIRETNSYNVRWRVPKLRQGYVVEIEPMALIFDNAQFSFQIDYSIVADNLPEAACGELHVVAASSGIP